MTMDGSQLIQSLESLWFFTNVVSSGTPNAASSGIEEETTQPTSSILQTGLQNHDEREFFTPKWGGLAAAEIEEHDGDEPVVMAEEVEIPKPAKKEEKRKRRPRRKRSKRKMPPLNDGMAMKEHLRSWAYAVAWTLR
ncbi:hypothetical protein OIU85_022757 [Salix viminalis]|uniref:Uncharacterized protein n=1 Tax=Salix viminalis TaxID=40686 RepID=A0A9Q0U7H4_SALVM|nr:hypothetical protein OIU85_022757 [Salix viminalis]